MDYTVLVWEVKRPPAPSKPREPLDARELQALRIALTGTDAAQAYRAIRKLVQVPEQAIPLVTEALRRMPPSPQASRLIDELDSNDFRTRQKAMEELKTVLSVIIL
jgi:hypothetical protein